MADVSAGELREALAAKVVTDVRETKEGHLEILFAGERDGEPVVVALTIGSRVVLDVSGS